MKTFRAATVDTVSMFALYESAYGIFGDTTYTRGMLVTCKGVK